MRLLLILSVLLTTGCGTIDKGRDWLADHISTQSECVETE